ncbi:MAG TPA: response regulator [Thermoanaerobaculia bacterium]
MKLALQLITHHSSLITRRPLWQGLRSNARSMTSKPKVLLVEDNADVRRLYAIGLNQRGFEVKLAANGAEAVDRVASERPDFMLLDWLMPLMDGSEVLEKIGTAEIDIIVISGQPAPNALPPRIRSWLTKPLTVDELVHELMRGDESARLNSQVRQVS